MSSSSAASSPPQPEGKFKNACLRCNGLKRRCNKALPACKTCAQRGQTCQYVDLALLRGNLLGAIESVKDVHALAFRAVLDAHGLNQNRVDQAISSYFKGVNTWFTIVDQSRFEPQARDLATNPSAETCVLVLCMSLIANPPKPRTGPSRTRSQGLGDDPYHFSKAILSLVQSKLPTAIPLLQAQLLIAMYEYSQSMPQQAYMSLGQCFQIAKMLGWHKRQFWSVERQAAAPRDMKLCSILWWSIVHLDCLLNVGYPDQAYPMLTAGLGHEPAIPFPEALDQYLPGGFASPGLAIMALPEAASAWYLNRVLQQLSDPGPTPAADRDALFELITEHTSKILSSKGRVGDRNAALGTNFIALTKLNQAGLVGGTSPLMAADQDQDRVRAAETTRHIVRVVRDDAAHLAQSADRLGTGTLTPCWAFAIYNASLLLVAHGNAVLREPDWLSTVEQLKDSLDTLSRRWRIAEGYSQSLGIALNSRLGGYAADVAR
ncbi:hypothetical protein BT67DRAFT_373791 [Trichocladium antarcticum]|uniref:Zn(2)-C6 fungal-type domain-containing protein n=1 Tax=Trichocladium antarcticum TaxID=1450529 RepID=A0AAN6URP0_9PEZI|nr:hypothetical protein BT67DRAFT_373791 [Trichocladium antarcticum]